MLVWEEADGLCFHMRVKLAYGPNKDSGNADKLSGSKTICHGSSIEHQKMFDGEDIRDFLEWIEESWKNLWYPCSTHGI
jgi:hypothetical protein